MSTYLAQEVLGSAGRPACARCGAAYRLHRATVNETGEQYLLACPEAYRSTTIEAAELEMDAATRTRLEEHFARDLAIYESAV